MYSCVKQVDSVYSKWKFYWKDCLDVWLRSVSFICKYKKINDFIFFILVYMQFYILCWLLYPLKNMFRAQQYGFFSDNAKAVNYFIKQQKIYITF